MDRRFMKVLDVVLAGETEDSKDPLGPCAEGKYGICGRDYPDLDLSGLTREQASELYYRDWWEKYAYARIRDDRIAAKVLDLAVLIGAADAHRLLQTAVNSTSPKWMIEENGDLGKQTIFMVNYHPAPDYLLAALKVCAVRYLLDRNQPELLEKSIRRVIR